MAVYGLTSSQVVDYVLTRDPCRGPKGEPLEGATIFKIGSISGFGMAYLRDMQVRAQIQEVDGADDVVVNVSMFEAAYDACRLGLVGWSNFKNGDGTDIAYETEYAQLGRKRYKAVKEACLSHLAPNDAMELMRAILANNMVSKEEEKNSDAAS